jgi:hypothetical protein
MLSGLSMLDKIDVSQLQKVTSEDDLQSAFTRREAMVSALKQQKKKGWQPEYVPKSIVPPSFKKGDVLRKTARVSAAMILQVGGSRVWWAGVGQIATYSPSSN